MKKNRTLQTVFLAALSLAGVFLTMVLMERLQYNYDTYPTCDRSKYPCEMQVVKSDRFGEMYEYCGNSVCEYPKVYDYRTYGGVGGALVVLSSYALLLLSLRKRKETYFWLYASLIPVGWIGMFLLYFFIYPS
ncbi:hypothetical protein BH11PAT4_BH11PAT4_5390 [soil metagenome]